MHIPASKYLLLALAAAASFQVHAQVHKVDVGTQLPRFSLLKEGTHRYLLFRKAGETNTPMQIWSREVRFETVNGERRMRIKQRWDGVSPSPSTRTLDSWFEVGTFRPLTHERISEKDGKRVVEGFAFAPDRVTGLKDLADNTRKDFSVASPEPTFNFETDMEFLQTLPLAEGYEAHINFYHPGGATPPQRYIWKVVGSETIAGPAGPVDCWLVTTDYNRPGAVTKFWLAKGTQLLVRQESTFPGGVSYKALID